MSKLIEVETPNEVRIPFPNAISAKYKLLACDNDPNAGNGRHHYRVLASNDDGEVDFEAVISFQKGALSEPEADHNGVLSNILLTVLIDHLKSFQDGDFASRYGAIAITDLEKALWALSARADERASRGVLGAHAK